MDPQVAIQIKVVTDITCSPGGGLDIHSLLVELPVGAVVKSTIPVKLDCWPKLESHVTVSQEKRLLTLASQNLEQFTTPVPETPGGATIGNVEAEYQESVFDVIWLPKTVDGPTVIETPVVGEVEKLMCADGAPPIAVADPFGNITYVCRDGSKPYSVRQSFFSSEGNAVGLPHTDEEEITQLITKPMVAVVAAEYYSNIPLVAIGCCTGGDASGSTTSSPTSSTTPTVTTTSDITTAAPTTTTAAPTTTEAPTTTPTVPPTSTDPPA